MSAPLLELLAERGITALTDDDFKRLGQYLRDHGVSTGDARYGVLADVIGAVNEWLGSHEEVGGVPARAQEELDTALKSCVKAALAAPSAAEGTRLVEDLRERLPLLLGGTRSWRTRGLADDPGRDH